MQRLSRALRSFYVPIIGCSFLLDTLYACKYSSHIGTCHLPYVYVKTVLFCASAGGLREVEREYVHGLIECFVPAGVSQEEQLKLELMHFVGAVPSHAGEDAKESEANGGGGSAVPPLSDAVTSFLSGALLPTRLARVLLYDAVSACVADLEYNDAERDRVALVAMKLGIPQHVREAIEKVAMQERQLTMRKRWLLMTGDATNS